MDAWWVARPCTPAHARARLVYPDMSPLRNSFTGNSIMYVRCPHGRFLPSAWTARSSLDTCRTTSTSPAHGSVAHLHIHIMCSTFFHTRALHQARCSTRSVTSPKVNCDSALYTRVFKLFHLPKKSGSTTSLPVGPVPPPSYDLSIMF